MLTRTRSGIVVLLCAVAAISLMQAGAILPASVLADNTISIQLLLGPGSTEQPSATGTVQVNLNNGRVTVELNQATPQSNYIVFFISASDSANVQVCTITTDQKGQGNAHGVLDSGTYFGVFEVLQAEQVQFTSASTSFTIGETASVSANVSTSESNPATFTLQVSPASGSINAGDFAKFDVTVTPSAKVAGSPRVLLVARDVPPNSVAIFNPSTGNANKEFHSKLTIVTSAHTPSGSYTVTAVAVVNGQEFTSQVTLQISAATSLTSAVAVSAPTNLLLTVTTDQSQYQPNATVTIQGQVTDSTGSAIADATVAIQSDSPTGEEVFFASNVQSDSSGTFQGEFTLQSSATLGTYTVFVTAVKQGYSNAAARTTFVVGSSSTPSVIITAVYAGDISGNPMSTFSVGQTVTIWVVVQNVGMTFQGLVWVQVRDPNGVPVQIGIHIADLHTGETVTEGIGFTLLNNLTPGVYRVDALVSDKLISQGGSFLANAQTQFALAG
jgi:hypothetical protein